MTDHPAGGRPVRRRHRRVDRPATGGSAEPVRPPTADDDAGWEETPATPRRDEEWWRAQRPPHWE